MTEKIDPPPLYYSDYLQLGTVLDSQRPKSTEHDEMLFVVTHQAYELWFKQVLFEVDSVLGLFGPPIDDNTSNMSTIVRRLKRVVRIFELLNRQVDILETMTPLDFLEFRSQLAPASGFQSAQFRLIEAKLGLRMDRRHEPGHYKHTGRGGFSDEDLKRITRAEESDTVKSSLCRWLERMPYFHSRYWGDYERRKEFYGAAPNDFWSDYRRAYEGSLADENLPGDPAARQERVDEKLKEFDDIFFRRGKDDLSATAMRAVLFIMLYRDLPIFQFPFDLLTTLTEIDELMSTWRYRHLMMVRRMIGLRVGTGGTSGKGYLEETLSKHYVFRELTEVTTFVIKRSELPALPGSLRVHTGFAL